MAAQLQLEFIDLDLAIEAKYHITIPRFFEKYGESVFRKCEFQTLKECLQRDNVLIATGGGAPCSEEAMKLINENSESIYLKLSEDKLVERLLNSKKKRPLTQHKTPDEMRDYVRTTLAAREPFYKMAKRVLSDF